MVTIELYSPKYKDDFIRLNKEWIERYFRLEPSDLKIFNDPEGEILKDGGQIFFAIKDGKAVGCCALENDTDTGQYKLVKMAVSTEERGNGIGTLLGHAMIDYAKEHGIKSILLEGNTTLTASMNLYRSLGFKEVEGHVSDFDRVDIIMTIDL